MSGTAPSSRGSCHLGAPSPDRASVRRLAASNTGFCVSGQLSLLPLAYLLTHSTPPDRNTSPSPALMAWKAIRVVCSEDEQYLVTVVPGRWSWPSMMATTRAMLKPCSPPGSPQPSMKSAMSAGSSWGTLASTAVTIWRTASSGRMVVRDPLNALPIGDLAVATITASGMAAPSDSLGLLVGSLRQGPALANCSLPLHDHRSGSVASLVSAGTGPGDSCRGIA